MISKYFFNKKYGKSQFFNLRFAFLFLLIFAFFLTSCANSKTEFTETDRQIKFYQDKIAKSPEHYPSYALLGNAYLSKARETGNPEFLTNARQNVRKSLEIQPNYQALKTMAMISNYSHRFAEASEWAEKAAQASPEGLSGDAELSSIMIESFLGLGQIEKAEKVLKELAKNKPDDFFTFASQGHFYKASNKVDEAAKAFSEAGNIAGKQNATEFVIWANVSAAGCFIDANRAAEAVPFLERAKNISPENKLLQIHQAEFLTAQDQPQEALKIYEKLLQKSDDAEIHRRIFLIARKLNDQNLAEKHFQAAVQGFQKVLENGEIYTLEPLAQIYCDADKNLAEAEKLARQNLEYKKDKSAERTLQCVMNRLKEQSE